MAFLETIQVPLQEILCENCGSNKDAIREIYTPYIRFDHQVKDDLQSAPILISMDVHKITWQRLEGGRYTAFAELSASCPGCEGIRALKYQLLAPIIVLMSVSKCSVCSSELSMEDEQIELNSNNGESPILSIRANMFCQGCKSRETREDVLCLPDEPALDSVQEIRLLCGERPPRLEFEVPGSLSSRSEQAAEKDLEDAIRQKYLRLFRATSSLEKGQALEDLLVQLLSTIKGLEVLDCNVNTATEEIDIVVRNQGSDVLWSKESYFILVECKNWSSQPVGKNEFVLFKEKILNRRGRCSLGFLVSTGKFAQTAKKEALRSSSSGVLIVLIDGTGLRQLVESRTRGILLRNLVDRAALY